MTAEIDLGGVVAIRELDVGANAASLRIFLPTVNMAGSIETNAGAAQVPPSDTSMRRSSEKLLASFLATIKSPMFVRKRTCAGASRMDACSP